MEPMISVIVPIYNTKDYLCACVDSILAQTYPNIEIILVDDGSTDGSAEICDAYAQKDMRVRVLHKPNGGQSTARNCGLEIAQGAYIGFADSDDVISPTMYEELMALMDGRSDRIANTVIMKADEHCVPIKGSQVRRSAVLQTDAVAYRRELLMHIGDSSVCSKLFPREIITKRRFDEYRLNEDLMLLFDMADEVDSFVYSDKPGYYYRTRSGSTTSGYGKAIEDMTDNAEKILEIVQSKMPELLQEAVRFVWRQRMIYLLLAPKQFGGKRNEKYARYVRAFRKHFLSEALPNPMLTRKEKIVIFGQCVSPALMARVYASGLR